MELNFQYAHHEADESESRIIKLEAEVLKAFDEFEWSREIVEAEKLKKCSPTLSLVLNRSDHLIWVSGFGEPQEPKFISNCRFPGQIPGFLGFGKRDGVVDLHADSLSLELARLALDHFAQNRHDQLRALYNGE
jgi:hypothetical protein